MRLPPTTTTNQGTYHPVDLRAVCLVRGHWKIVWVAVRLEGNRETWTVVLVVVNGRESIAKPAPFSGTLGLFTANFALFVSSRVRRVVSFSITRHP